MFIVIEGIDLIGKTTQHEMLVEQLRSWGEVVSSYSFPAYESPTGRVISDHLRGRVRTCTVDTDLARSTGDVDDSEHDDLVFQCLQLVDKYALAPEISGRLALGQTVVACRWWQSACAYGVESGLDEGWVRRSCACLPRADVNVLLDLDPAAARRRPGELPDRVEADLDRQRRIRQRYLDMWRGTHVDGCWDVVDAGGSVAEVHARVVEVVATAVQSLGRVRRVVFTDGSRGRTW